MAAIPQIGASAFGLMLVATAAQASTFTSDLAFATSTSLFGGAPLSDFEVGPGDFGIRGFAEVSYYAKASAGTLDAEAKVRLEARHPDKLGLSAAAATPIDLSFADIPVFPGITVPGTYGAFETDFGIEARVEVTLIGAADLRLLDIDGLLETSEATFKPLNNTLSADDQARIAKAGSIAEDPILHTRWGAEARVYATQASELSFGELGGTVRATHEDGTIVTDTFSFAHSESLSLDLRRLGDWTLELIDITVPGHFSSDFGMRITGEACVAVCGSISSGVLPLGSSSFDLTFPDRSMALGTMSVVPLPAGLPLLAGALGGLSLLRRRRARA